MVAVGLALDCCDSGGGESCEDEGAGAGGGAPDDAGAGFAGFAGFAGLAKLEH